MPAQGESQKKRKGGGEAVGVSYAWIVIDTWWAI